MEDMIGREELDRRKDGCSPPNNKGFESERGYPLPEAEHEGRV